MKICAYITLLLLVSVSGLINAEDNTMPMKQGKMTGQVNSAEPISADVEIDVEMDTAEKMHGSMSAATDSSEQDTKKEVVESNLEGFSRGSVVRSIFTSAIEEREPADQVKELTNNNDKIIYYTELRDMAGQIAKHRWEYNGEVMAEVEFNVKGQRWRVWSSKSFAPQWTGEWKVSVLNGANEVISEDILTYAAVTETTTDSTPAMENPAIETMPSTMH